jgi:hypothetical protein
MSASQDQYTDLNTVKAFLSIGDTDTSQDAFLTAIIPMVQTFIDRYTGRTFGWGDEDSNEGIIDDVNTDWSNTDCIAIQSVALNGTLLTINTAGPNPFVVGQNISLFGSPTSAYNGVWAVTTRNSATQLIVETNTSKGTLLASRSALVASGAGYIGNAVTNYKFVTQEQHDGFVGNTIYLRNMDIRSVDSVYLGLRNSGQPVLLDPSQYVWQDDGRLILGGSFFNSYNSNLYGDGSTSSFYGEVASGTQTIMASYWYGHIGVPPELSLAAVDLVIAYHTLRKSAGIQRERVGDYDVQYDVTFRKLLQTQPDNLNTLNIMRRRHV